MFSSCWNTFFLILTEGIMHMALPPAPLTLVELWIMNDGVGHAVHGGRSLAPPTHRLSRWFQTLKQPKSNLADGYIAELLGKMCSNKMRTPFLYDLNTHSIMGFSVLNTPKQPFAHNYCVELSNARINQFSDGFFPSTSCLWNSLPPLFLSSFNFPSKVRSITTLGTRWQEFFFPSYIKLLLF